MTQKQKSFFLGLGLLVNTIVGVGIFGLPYIASRAGFAAVLIFFLVLSLVVHLIHRAYGEVVFATPGHHRFPGYVGVWMGPAWKNVALIVNVLGITMALVAYLIVGGTFVSSLLGLVLPMSLVIGILIFFIAGVVLIFRGRTAIASTELVFLGLFILLLLIVFISGVSQIQVSNLLTFSPSYLFLPYGIVFFSFWGSSIIPELKEISGGSRETVQKTLRWGIRISLIIYTVFVLVVLGITGLSTSREALSGLTSHFGTPIVIIGYLLGIITTFTSFLSLGLTLKRIYAYDLKIPPTLSAVVACVSPLALYVIGVTNYIESITFVGSVLLGIEGIILFVVFRKVTASKPSLHAQWLLPIIVALFILGVVAEAYMFISSKLV